MRSDREPSARRYRRFFGADPTRDADEELAFHLAMRIDEFKRAGLNDQQAEEAAMNRFGDYSAIQSEMHEIDTRLHARRRRDWNLDALRQDLRFATRTLLAQPAYTLAVALTMALGIGANTAVFSVAYGVILRPLPFRDANRLVRLWSRNDARHLEFFSVSPADYKDWRAQSQAFVAMAAYERQHDATLMLGTSPQSVLTTRVTPDLFSLLGTGASRGRTLLPADAARDAQAVAVVSYDLWLTTFGADNALLGRPIELDGRRYTVVGVMPEHFALPGSPARIWTALSLDDASDVHSNRYLRVLGRLAPGKSFDAARTEMDVIAARLARQFPADDAAWTVNMVSVPETMIGTQFRRAVLTLLAVVAFVLLIACANATNLQLARAAVREREMAVRAALGASGGRLVLQLLTETTLVTGLAAILGVALAYGGLVLLKMVGTTTVPRLDEVTIDGPVLAFAAVVALGSALLAGILPALRASRPALVETLKQGGRSAGRGVVAAGVRAALVVAEVSLSLVLLVGAGLLLRSFAKLQSVDVGFSARNVAVVPVRLPDSAYAEPARSGAFHEELLTRVGRLPGVVSVAAVSSAPFAGVNPGMPFLPEGEQAVGSQVPGADYRIVSAGYFRTIGIPLLHGRDIATTDRAGAPGVVVISRTLAQRHWPTRDPIGQRIRIGDLVRGPLLTIVGVVDDAHYGQLEDPEIRPMFYLSAHAQSPREMALVARLSGPDVGPLTTAMRDVISSLDRRLPAPAVLKLEDLLGQATATRRFAMVLFAVFAGVALLLATVGLYSVLAYLVRQRTLELGIRVALGAPRSAIVRSVVGAGVRLVVIGLVIGLIAAAGLTRMMSALLFGVDPIDPVTFAAIAALLLATGVAASMVPAIRATRADPMLAMRGDG